MSEPEQQPNVVRLDLDMADIGMALEMWQASPDGRDHIERKLAELPDATIEIRGERVADDDDPMQGGSIN